MAIITPPPPPPPLPAIATGFVRKLYRILDQENAAVISWDADGASFLVRDEAALETLVLPRYFRGRLSAFRQQLREHGFTLEPAERGQERYRHEFFRRGCPDSLRLITHSPLPRRRPSRKKKRKPTTIAAAAALTPAGASPKKQQNNRGAHRVTPYPESEMKHATIEDPAALAANPLFAEDDESLRGFVQGLAVESLTVRCMETDEPMRGAETKETPLSDEMMDTLLTLLNNSLSTDRRDGNIDAGLGEHSIPPTISTLLASGTSNNSTSSNGNIFSEGRAPVELPTLPLGITETHQFSDDTINCLMHWASASDTYR
ncbi:hypothetical protein BBJ28_00013741 [Nothophytophthora sp. Chile5]|nr:hypothetical protein BBJ28_00013741 [Nothophytophthora sp. Chile5]